MFRAGRTALAHIRKNGLSPGDIRVVLGASGAAKWLGIYGLDRAVFSEWLPRSSRVVHLFGTSVGAWKLAAAAQTNPGAAFDRLRSAYICQTYRGRVTAARVTAESLKILSRFIPGGAVREILEHPRFRFGCSAVRCRGLMRSEKTVPQAAGMGTAFVMNLVSRRTQALLFRRTLFAVPGPWPLDMSDSATDRAVLTPENFKPALLASGSIPVVMEGVTGIPGALAGIYRDGGILDYHPSFPLKPDEKGLILYPHFYSTVTPGWFDKTLPGRRANGRVMDRTLLVAPSPGFVATLPFGRIPDRKDFNRFIGQDALRYETWTEASRKSLELGEAFLESVDTGCIREMVVPL